MRIIRYAHNALARIVLRYFRLSSLCLSFPIVCITLTGLSAAAVCPTRQASAIFSPGVKPQIGPPAHCQPRQTIFGGCRRVSSVRGAVRGLWGFLRGLAVSAAGGGLRLSAHYKLTVQKKTPYRWSGRGCNANRSRRLSGGSNR